MTKRTVGPNARKLEAHPQMGAAQLVESGSTFDQAIGLYLTVRKIAPIFNFIPC
jgi:hypothetical protein